MLSARPPPQGHVLCVGMNNYKRQVGSWERARFQSGCGAEGKKCVCHGVEVPYGTEEKLLREQGGVRLCRAEEAGRTMW